MVKFPCVILAGGKSSRMGHGDKFSRLLAGRPMLQHVLDRLKPQVSSLVLNANIPIDFRDINVIPDLTEHSVGPLGGILTGLDYFASAKGEASHLFVCPCDVPFIPGDVSQKLFAALTGKENEIVMASSHGRVHPVVSLWPFSIVEDLRYALEVGGARKVIDFAKRYNLKEVAWSEAADPFFNVNTPEDLALAEARARGQS